MSIANYKCHVTSDAWCLFSRERWSKTEIIGIWNVFSPISLRISVVQTFVSEDMR